MRLFSSVLSTSHDAFAFANCWVSSWEPCLSCRNSPLRSCSATFRSAKVLLTALVCRQTQIIHVRVRERACAHVQEFHFSHLDSRAEWLFVCRTSLVSLVGGARQVLFLQQQVEVFQAVYLKNQSQCSITCQLNEATFPHFWVFYAFKNWEHIPAF